MGVVKKFKSVEDMLDWIYSNYSADELWQSYFLRGVNTDVEEFNEEEFLEARSREIEPEATRILQEEGVEAVKEYMAEQGYEDWWVEDGEVWFSHPGVYADFAADPHLSIEQYPTVVFFKGKYLYYYGDGAIVVPEKVIAIAPKNGDPPGENGVGAAPRIEKKPAEKPFSELARKLAIEKLTYFTKAKALELGFSVGEANRIVRDLKDELALLGTGIVTGDTTQEAAEREIEEGLRNLKRKKEEEERRKEEEKERKAPRMSKREALTRIKRDVEIALRDKGYRGVTKALSYIRPELEALAEDVAEGNLTVEEAVKRAIDLARQYATPPKPGAPPAAPGVEVRPEGFLSASEAADIIWNEYPGDLFNFGVRYVFENYMRERGMLEQDLGRVAGRLASKLRHLGSEMRKRGEETGIGRYIWASQALTKYAPEIVQFGLLWAMRKIVPEIWPELRLFGNVVEALRETGIEGSIAKALTGVVYDYLAIPPDKWPEDIRRCYEVFVEASREASQPRKGGERDLWRLYG